MNLDNKSLPLVLLGDPDPESARRLTSLLEAWQYSVTVVRSSTEALARLAATPSPAVALLDNNLLPLSGIEVVQEWHSQPRKTSVWTIVLSAQATSGEVLLARDAGVNDLLVKPVPDTDLQVRLKTAERVQALHAELGDSVQATHPSASRDNLTGLCNREAMLGILFQETDRVQRMQTSLSLMLLDLDNFSLVNAENGFKAGDQLLQQVVERFRRYLRSYDLMGRYGADEFLVALPGCDNEHALIIANRLRRCIFHRPFDLSPDTLIMTASFGVALSKGRSPLIVLREAENALLQAKLAGGDNVVRFGEVRPPEPHRDPLISTQKLA